MCWNMTGAPLVAVTVSDAALLVALPALLLTRTLNVDPLSPIDTAGVV
jgi:hypothetical protein